MFLSLCFVQQAFVERNNTSWLINWALERKVSSRVGEIVFPINLSIFSLSLSLSSWIRCLLAQVYVFDRDEYVKREISFIFSWMIDD